MPLAVSNSLSVTEGKCVGSLMTCVRSKESFIITTRRNNPLTKGECNCGAGARGFVGSILKIFIIIIKNDLESNLE